MISISKLEKQFTKESHICFNDYIFEKGKTYVITGPSGCGKSTLLNLIAGILTPDKGSITIETVAGQNVQLEKLSQKQRDAFRFANIGYVFQDFKLIDEFTVKDNMSIWNINGKQYSHSDICNALTLTHMDTKIHQKVKTLSGGEKQRVSIARAIMKKSNIVLADEPTESLNASLSHEIIQLLTNVAKKEEKTLIMVTHDTSLTKYFDVHIDASDFLKEGKADV
jgi:putative ABC transport system ATP-binding protein